MTAAFIALLSMLIAVAVTLAVLGLLGILDERRAARYAATRRAALDKADAHVKEGHFQ